VTSWLDDVSELSLRFIRNKNHILSRPGYKHRGVYWSTYGISNDERQVQNRDLEDCSEIKGEQPVFTFEPNCRKPLSFTSPSNSQILFHQHQRRNRFYYKPESFIIGHDSSRYSGGW